MTGQILESDWKRFKVVHEGALERHCVATMDHVAEMAKVANEGEQDPREGYLKVFNYIKKREKEVDQVFGDYRRSTAVHQLALMQGLEAQQTVWLRVSW